MAGGVPYSPELQPAEHLWPLTNAALVNQYFATIVDLEDAQFARCATLQQQPGNKPHSTRWSKLPSDTPVSLVADQINGWAQTLSNANEITVRAVE